MAFFSCSRSLDVGRSVGRSVCLSYTFVKKWPLEYQMVTKTYLPSNLCDSSDGNDSSYRSDNIDRSDRSDSNDSSDSCDSSDSSDSTDSSDSGDRSDKKKFCHILFCLNNFDNSTQIVTKLKTQIVT